jgi:TrmH family RNA methyltransferase
VFEVPLARAPTVADLPGPTVALSGDATPVLSDLELDGVTFLVGAERDGLPVDVLQAADEVVRIPIQTHSLNAAMAATIALYEATRMAAG